MLRVTPSDRLYVDVPANGSTTRDYFTLTNLLHSPVSFKIEVKAENNSAAKIVTISPKNGLALPERSQRVTITSAAKDGIIQDDWLPSVCRIVIQSRVSTGESNVTHSSGDKSNSLFDVVGDGFSPDQPVHTRELDVIFNFVQNFPSPKAGAQTSISMLRMTSSPFSSPQKNGDANSVISSIQDLVASNELLSVQVSKMEMQHREDVEKLKAAKREVEEAKVASQITSHLLKQLEELRDSKDTLEEEVNQLKLKDLEEKEHMREKDIKLEALHMESERLSKENLRLKLEDSGCERILYPDQSFPRTSGMIARPTPSPRFTLRREKIKSMFQQDEIEDGDKLETKRHFVHFGDTGTSSSHEAGSKGSDSASSLKLRRGSCKKPWACDEENLLFFFKNVTMVFGGLTLLAAINILVTDIL